MRAIIFVGVLGLLLLGAKPCPRNPHDKSCDYIAGLEEAQMAASETALGYVCHYSGRKSKRCAGAIEVMKAVDEALEYRRDERDFWFEPPRGEEP